MIAWITLLRPSLTTHVFVGILTVSSPETLKVTKEVIIEKVMTLEMVFYSLSQCPESLVAVYFHCTKNEVFH